MSMSRLMWDIKINLFFSPLFLISVRLINFQIRTMASITWLFCGTLTLEFEVLCPYKLGFGTLQN